LNRSILELFIGFRLSLHSQEDHFLLAHLFDGLTSKNGANSSLSEFSGGILFFLLGKVNLLALGVLTGSLFLVDLGDLLCDLVITETTLATTLVFLNQADGRDDFHVQGERVVHNFDLGLG
jgi:hypothetical protein